MIARLSAILFCTLFSTWQYVTVSLATCGNCTQQIQAIYDGTAQAPFVYRVLSPAILVIMGNTPQAFTLYHMALFAVFFSLLWQWARRWQANPLTVLFAVSLALVVMFPTMYFSIWSVLEWDLMLGALLLLPPYSPLPPSPVN